MMAERRLWSGPYGSALRDRAIRQGPAEPSSLWLLPSPLAQQQALELLAGSAEVTAGLRVWCWDELWTAITSGVDEPPARLSPAAQRAALQAAIERARRRDGLDAVRRVVDTAGFRRRLLTRIASWTRAERWPRRGPAEDSPTGRDEWAIYRRYREVLKHIQAEDPEGLASWASKQLAAEGQSIFAKPGAVVVIDPLDTSEAVNRALAWLRDHAGSMLVTLPWDSDPALAEPYATVAPRRQKLLGWGFTETQFAAETDRPHGLGCSEQTLFHHDAHTARLSSAGGLAIWGAPQGEGLAMVAAHRVRESLRAGARPDDVLVLVRDWDDQTAQILETLQAWQIPVSAQPRANLDAAPEVAALILAMKVPAENWEASSLAALLHHSLVRPEWADPMALRAAAAAVRDARVFRGRDALRKALQRTVERSKAADSPGGRASLFQKAGRAQLAIEIVDRLAKLFDPITEAAPWPRLVDRLQSLASALGLGDSPSIEHLLNALDDHSLVFAGLGEDDSFWTWPEFAAELAALAREIERPPEPPQAGSVRVATLAEATGARARHVLLASLAEGTFPTREAVEPQPGSLPAHAISPALSAEMLAFLRVLGSAESSVDLLYPTVDDKGQALLKAGFLEDLERLFDSDTRQALVHEIRRVDPHQLPAEFAGSPRDARLRALAQAASGHTTELERLARSPDHRPALLGTAAALWTAHFRLDTGRSFGRYDGRLRSPELIARLDGKFETFSPSQLETLAACPFEFYSRYVLGLEPIDERDEFEDDRARRGELLHRVLERLHLSLPEAPTGDHTRLAQLIAHRIDATIEAVLDEEEAAASEIDACLRQIEATRLRQTGERYKQQFAEYARKAGAPIACQLVEIRFGDGEPESPPCLELGQQPAVVRIRGTIDRIDVIEADAGPQFRVIDYKSGKCPRPRDLKAGLALQLPLYALAAERLNLAAPSASAAGFGYWSLKDEGYQKRDAANWAEAAERLETFILELVKTLLDGSFPIAPRKEKCTQSCDYSPICRVGQVRAVGKTWTEAPRLEGAP